MEAREAYADLEDRILKLEDILKQAVIVKEKHGTVIDIGSTVVAKNKTTGETAEYSIVGTEEADPHVNKLSNESPIGASFMGKKAGDETSAKVPSGAIIHYKIVEVK